MGTLVDYKGLQVVEPDPDNLGGVAIKDDFQELADRAGPVKSAVFDPTASDDSEGTAGNGQFYVWSKWLNTSSGSVFVCTNDTPLAAVWVKLETAGGGPGNIAQVQKTSAIQNVAVASITATFASTPVAGNLLLAVAISQRPFPAIATPAGWSLAVRIPFGASGATLGGAIFYRVAGASEPTAVTVANLASTARMGLAIFEYSGLVNVQANVLDVTAFNYGADVNNFQAFTGTTSTSSQANTLVIAAAAGDGNAGAWNNDWSNGFTQEIAVVGVAGTSVSFSVAARIPNALGGFGTGVSWTTAARISASIAVFKGA